jgi:hypothetical protein
VKEAYAVRRTVPPSAEIQAEIDKLLGRGIVGDPQKMLGELARLGARLIIQRAVEEEFDTWLGCGRYERRRERRRGLRNYDSGLRNGLRPRHVQTVEGELRAIRTNLRLTCRNFGLPRLPSRLSATRSTKISATSKSSS